MKFTKMQGIGNDYIYVNCFEEKVSDPEQLAIKLSDRHLGIGSDGLILILPSETADCRMQMFNSDGTQSKMCGNGIRCVGKYVYDHGIINRKKILVETGAGVKELQLLASDGKVTEVTVDMGIPKVTSEVPEPILVNEKNYEFVGIDMGNPHAVCYEAEIDSLDLDKDGPPFEHHRRFPDRTNVEFIQLLDRKHIRMRVWERGSGETKACGTGAAASAAASILRGFTDRSVEVELPGGRLKILWNEENGHIYLTGPAVEVFNGEIDVNEIL